MLKKCQIVMLPIKQKAQNCLVKYNDSKLILQFKPDYYYTQDYLKSIYAEAHHLYVISDDKIEDGDWFLNTRNNVISQCAKDDINSLGYFNPDHTAFLWIQDWHKKIIATTNTFLDVTNEDKDFKEWKLLPKLSVGFIEKYIEKYNAHREIVYVMVNYDVIREVLIPGKEYFLDKREWKMTIIQNKAVYLKPSFVTGHSQADRKERAEILVDEKEDTRLLCDPKSLVLGFEPKLNRNLEVTIKPVKETFEREEVKKLLRIALLTGSSCVSDWKKSDKGFNDNANEYIEKQLDNL